MKRLFAMLLCVSLLLTGCFGGDFDLGEMTGLNDLLDSFQENPTADPSGSISKDPATDQPPVSVQGDRTPADGPQETVPGIPEHIQNWTDPLEDIPDPTLYVIDEEMQLALSFIGIEIIPPEDTLYDAPTPNPTDGLWSTERDYSYQGTLTAENLQDFFAMYAGDADLTAMPPIMEPTPEPIGGTEDPGPVRKSYEEFYNEQSIMVARFENLAEDLVDAYNETAEWEDTIYMWLLAFNSSRFSMGSSFDEETDWASMSQGMAMAYEMMWGADVVCTRNDAYDYTVTYTSYDGEAKADHFRVFENGVQMRCYTDGELTEFVEYMELGNDTYVWQSARERMVMVCRDKTVLEAYYSNLTEESVYYGEEDWIFGAEGTYDAQWVLGRETFHTAIAYDGTTMEVHTALTLFGSATHAVITPNPGE